jgi:hypothetical protein
MSATPLRQRAFQIAITLLAVGTLTDAAVHVLRPDLMQRHGRLLSEALSATSGVRIVDAAVPAAALYAHIAVSLAAAAFALALVWRAGQRPEARALALLLSTAFFPSFSAASLGMPYPALVAMQGVLHWVYLGAFVRFAALFPRPLTLDDLEGAAQARAARRGREPRAVGRMRWMLNPAAVWGGVAGAAALAVGGTLTRQPLVQVLLVPVLVWSLVRGLGLLRAGYAVADPVGQRRILWVVQGLYTMLWLGVVMVGSIGYGILEGYRAVRDGVAPDQITIPAGVLATVAVTQSLAVLVMMLCFAFAIFFQGALDPALALRRTTIYGGLAVCGALLFAAVENAASSLLAGMLGMSEGMGAAVAGGVVALAFGPLRDRIARVVEARLGSDEPEAPAAEVALA